MWRIKVGVPFQNKKAMPENATNKEFIVSLAALYGKKCRYEKVELLIPRPQRKN
jgi:hypothetical protein